jgi:hypothetical protein
VPGGDERGAGGDRPAGLEEDRRRGLVAGFGRRRHVGGQLEHVEHHPGAALGRQLGGDGGVDALSFGWSDVVVDGRPHDRVAELVAARHLHQQAGLHQAVEGTTDLLQGRAGEALHQAQVAEREPPEDRQDLGQLGIGGCAADQPAEQGGTGPQRGRRRIGHEPGPAIGHHRPPGFGEGERQLLGEEGIALRGRVHDVGERLVGGGAEHGGDEGLGVVAVEGLEVDHRGPPVVSHLLEQPLELHSSARAKGDDGEHAHVGESGEEGDEGHRLAVGSVEVLEDEHERAGPGDGAQELDPGGEDAAEVALLVGRGGGVERGPHGVGGGQHRAAEGAAVVEDEAGEHVPEQGVRDAVVEVVGPARQHRVAKAPGARRQLGHQPRLADPRRTPHQEPHRRAPLHPLELLQADGHVELASHQRCHGDHRPTPFPAEPYGGADVGVTPLPPLPPVGRGWVRPTEEGDGWTRKGIATTATRTSPRSSSATWPSATSWARR